MGQPRLAIVIPAFREEATIEAVVRNIIGYAEVIVVDDCSPDATAERARTAGASVVTLPANVGYDGALARGFEEASALGCTHVVTMDADGEHDPATLPAFYEALLGEGVPLVLGVRPRKQRIAEVVMGWWVHARYGARDILCGMKGYDLALWRANGGFDHSGGIGTELALFALERGLAFREVAVTGVPRQDAPRFDRPFRANLRILRALLGAMKEARNRRG